MTKIQIPEKNSVSYHWIKKQLEIMVINHRGKVYVARSMCPHMGARLVFNPNKQVLECPWHGLTFDLETLRSANQRFRMLPKLSFSLDGPFIKIDT